MPQAGLADRISVFATEFQGKPVVSSEEPEESLLSLNNIPNNVLIMIAAGIALSLIVLILVLVLRRRKRKNAEEEDEFGFEMFNQALSKAKQDEEEEEIDLSNIGSKNPKRKTIEKLAQGRPEDFAKLLRSWMADD